MEKAHVFGPQDPKLEFKPFTIDLQEVGRIAVTYTFMTEEELDFWWENRGLPGATLRYGDETIDDF